MHALQTSRSAFQDMAWILALAQSAQNFRFRIYESTTARSPVDIFLVAPSVQISCRKARWMPRTLTTLRTLANYTRKFIKFAPDKQCAGRAWHCRQFMQHHLKTITQDPSVAMK